MVCLATKTGFLILLHLALKKLLIQIFCKKMDSIIIRKYKPEDHKDVLRIFGAGMSDMQTIQNGIALGRKSPYVIGYLTILFLMGSLYSIFYGFIALTIGLSFHAFIVYFFFNFYTWYVYILY